MPSTDFSVKFIVDRKTPEAVIEITDASTDISNLEGVLKIVYPDGFEVQNSDFDSPDISTPSGIHNLPLRTNSKNSPLTGTYIITYTVIDTDTETTYTEQKAFNFTWEEPTLSISNTSDSVIPEVKFKDETEYDQGLFSETYNTWTLEADTPSTSEVGVNTLSENLSSGSREIDVVYSGSYYEGVYSPEIDINILYDHTSESYLSVSFIDTYTQEFIVNKAPTETELNNYIKTFKDQMSLGEKSVYKYAISLFEDLKGRFAVGVTDGTESIVTELLEVLNITYDEVYQEEPMEPFTLSVGGGGSGLNNLQDAGSNVTNTASGTGYFSWSSVRLQGNRMYNGSSNESIHIQGSPSGANIELYGNSHTTNPSDIIFRKNFSAVLTYDGSSDVWSTSFGHTFNISDPDDIITKGYADINYGGDVSKSGTPDNLQITRWVSGSTVKGTENLLFDDSIGNYRTLRIKAPNDNAAAGISLGTDSSPSHFTLSAYASQSGGNSNNVAFNNLYGGMFFTVGSGGSGFGVLSLSESETRINNPLIIVDSISSDISSIRFDSKRLANVADPISNQDVVTKSYAEDNYGGEVSINGSPSNNQLAIWTNTSTIEGSSGLTWDGNFLLIEGGDNRARFGDLTTTHIVDSTSSPAIRILDSTVIANSLDTGSVPIREWRTSLSSSPFVPSNRPLFAWSSNTETYLSILAGGSTDHHGKSVKNIADPVDNQDAVTKAYLEANSLSLSSTTQSGSILTKSSGTGTIGSSQIRFRKIGDMVICSGAVNLSGQTGTVVIEVNTPSGFSKNSSSCISSNVARGNYIGNIGYIENGSSGNFDLIVNDTASPSSIGFTYIYFTDD